MAHLNPDVVRNHWFLQVRKPSFESSAVTNVSIRAYFDEFNLRLSIFYVPIQPRFYQYKSLSTFVCRCFGASKYYILIQIALDSLDSGCNNRWNIQILTFEALDPRGLA